MKTAINPIQAIVGIVVIVAATFSSSEGNLSGDALVGIYAAVLGYAFGFSNGSTIQKYKDA